MKIVKLLALALLIAGNADAQYFQHVYGGPRNDYLESGVNAAVPFAPQGHIMTGYTDQFVLDALMVTSTDLNGNVPFGPNTFNNWYRIVENNQVVDSKGRRVLQLNNATQQLCVWGDFGYNPGAVSVKFFYMALGANGAPGPITAYALPFAVAEVQATSMCQSTSGATAGNVFVCGWYRLMAGGPRTPIVMCLNAATGGLVWSWNYVIANVTVPVDWAPMDLVESPYPSAAGTVDIALTGHFVQPFIPVLSGFFFLVDAFTGAPSGVPGLVTYGTTTANGAFNAIDVANNPFGSGNGFVLGGYFFNANVGNDDSWAMKIDPTGTIINFSQLHDYFPSDFNYANDIIERRNTAGNFEYYLGGYVNNGFFGGNDDVVFKLTASGGGVPFGQFTYGGPGNEQAMQLDQYNGLGINNDGLSVFGNTDGNSWTFLGGNDFYFVKAYYNGVTACFYDTMNHDSLRGPGIVEWWQPRNLNKLKRNPLTAAFSTMQDAPICFTPFDPNGNNARMAQAQQALSQPGYFPNPVSRNNAVVTVTFGNVVVAGDAEIELWNSLGQLCWTKKSSLTDGQTQLQIELGNELSNGMYHLIVRQNGSMNNYRILVQ